MEIYGHICYTHPDPAVMEKLDALLFADRIDEAAMVRQAIAATPEHGEALVRELIAAATAVGSADLGGESLTRVDGYSRATFTPGSMGHELVRAMVSYLYQLAPGVHVQAWGHGDEEPWEYWLRYDTVKTRFAREKLKLVMRENEPFQDDKTDSRARDTIYDWWHRDMPPGIKVGT